MMSFLNFSENDISRSDQIILSYSVQDVVREKILLKRGKLQDYAVFLNGKTTFMVKGGKLKSILLPF